MRDCVASCINHLGLGTHSIITSWCYAAGSGHRQLARQVGDTLRDIPLLFPFDIQDGGQIQPIFHGSLGFAPGGIRDLVRES